MSKLKFYALIVGGGSGSRMESTMPKQFLQLKDRPILMHTIEAFQSSSFTPEIIVVLNINFHHYWEKLCIDHHFTIPHQLVSGGEQRFHSVKNGLKFITHPGVVAIHDAVRPCISRHVIDAAYAQAKDVGNAVAAVKSRDSIRQNTDNGTTSLKREDIYLIQTPQVFRSEILQKAFEQDYREDFTDDASVVERSGVTIKLVEGDRKNLKITFEEDILVAKIFLDSRK